MFNKKYCIRIAIFSINIASCLCYVNYEIFKGFDLYNNKTHSVNNTRLDLRNPTSNVTKTSNVVKIRTNPIRTYKNETVIPKKRPSMKFKTFKMKCPETEHPMSLGSYEIPTQRDLVLFTKRTLVKMFNSYHEKTLLLLKDIREATRATQEYEKNCRGKDKATYKNCVKRVSKKCVSITKDLVALLEDQKQSVNALIEEKTCNMNKMKTDPMQLVKTLAMDEASLEFALPAFLRLIGGCSTHCSKKSAKARAIGRPLRHMTDQDLVVKHFLTRKNYIQLIKDSDAHLE